LSGGERLAGKPFYAASKAQLTRRALRLCCSTW
jgi:hypothetical protein